MSCGVVVSISVAKNKGAIVKRDTLETSQISAGLRNKEDRMTKRKANGNIEKVGACTAETRTPVS